MMNGGWCASPTSGLFVEIDNAFGFDGLEVKRRETLEIS